MEGFKLDDIERKRINMILPAQLVDEIDEIAKNMGLNRTAYFVHVLQKEKTLNTLYKAMNLANNKVNDEYMALIEKAVKLAENNNNK